MWRKHRKKQSTTDEHPQASTWRWANLSNAKWVEFFFIRWPLVHISVGFLAETFNCSGHPYISLIGYLTTCYEHVFAIKSHLCSPHRLNLSQQTSWFDYFTEFCRLAASRRASAWSCVHIFLLVFFVNCKFQLRPKWGGRLLPHNSERKRKVCETTISRVDMFEHSTRFLNVANYASLRRCGKRSGWS